MRLQLVLCDDWHGNIGCLVAQDLALLTKVRTLIHEETELLTVLYIPFRVRTPKTTRFEIALTVPKQSLFRSNRFLILASSKFDASWHQA
jgi:hypothetical protein